MLPALDFTDYPSLLAARVAAEQLGRSGSLYEPANPITASTMTVPGPTGGPAVAVRVLQPERRSDAVPGLLYIHGGGFVMNDLDLTYSTVQRIVDQLGVVVVAVEYRLAPEDPFPAAVEDCYTALNWMTADAAELDIDVTRIGVAGGSAGGGLAAAVALVARDRGGPSLCFQYLNIPELDDRMNTPSMLAYLDTPECDRDTVVFSWRCYLDTDPGGVDISPYAAPARAENLTDLPPAFVSVCQFDPLRDEGIAYAQKLMAANVPTELHHYPGTFHSSSMIEHAAVSRRMIGDELAALRRGLRITT